jgi:hypothetical protein
MMKIERVYTFTVVMFACLLQQAVSAGTPEKTGKDTVWQSFIADTGKWHPETFYIVYPDLKMTFDLPYEDDRSGVANLLFIDKNTGGVRLLDTVIYKLFYARL